MYFRIIQFRFPRIVPLCCPQNTYHKPQTDTDCHFLAGLRVAHSSKRTEPAGSSSPSVQRREDASNVQRQINTLMVHTYSTLHCASEQRKWSALSRFCVGSIMKNIQLSYGNRVVLFCKEAKLAQHTLYAICCS